jgi:hypothetical protein
MRRFFNLNINFSVSKVFSKDIFKGDIASALGQSIDGKKWKAHAGLTGSYDELFDGINWPCGQLLQSGINWIT